MTSLVYNSYTTRSALQAGGCGFDPRRLHSKSGNTKDLTHRNPVTMWVTNSVAIVVTNPSDGRHHRRTTPPSTAGDTAPHHRETYNPGPHRPGSFLRRYLSP